MNHCCRSPSEASRKQFGAKRTASDLAHYRKRGPGSTTLGLLHGLAAAGLQPQTLLDIGAGIGALSFELLSAGIISATCIDISPSFMEGGQAEAERRGVASRIS